MNDELFSENICARHEVTAIRSDECPYCRVAELEKLVNELLEQVQKQTEERLQ
jgi:hypothetical protein